MSRLPHVRDYLRRVRALEVDVEAATQALEACISEARSRFGEDSIVIETADGYIWVPGHLQCVAITVKGARCKNSVFDGQVWTYGPGGAARLDHSWEGRLLSQTCNVHEAAEAKNHLPVEWVFISRESVWE